jgi:hypothetical protein
MLRELLDTVNTNMAALESLNIPVASWDAVIVLIIFQKLDYSTKREWQMTLDNSIRIPTYKKRIQFLEKRCTVLEALNALHPTNKTMPKRIISKQVNREHLRMQV